MNKFDFISFWFTLYMPFYRNKTPGVPTVRKPCQVRQLYPNLIHKFKRFRNSRMKLVKIDNKFLVCQVEPRLASFDGNDWAQWE